MKILFVYPDIISERGYLKYLSHGIAYLSAVLEENNHITALCHLTQLSPALVAGKIQDFSPDIIAISSTTNQWGYSEEIARFIKENYDIPIFAGGIHPTIKPECLYETEFIDGICRGEGEYALLDLANKIEGGENYFDTKNFWFRNNANIIKNDVRPLIEELDELPYPDKELFDFGCLIKSPEGARFMFSRGCPFSCSYCVNPTLRRIYHGKGKYIRHRSVPKAISEIEMVTSKYDLRQNYLVFDDDTFTLNKKWLVDFCAQYKQRINIPFVCNVRPGSADKEILRELKEAGCEEVRIGLESGDPYIRNEILKRSMSNEEVVDAFRLSREVGLKTSSFNMIGIPEETPQRFKRTIELNREAKPDRLQLSTLYPYPGTEIEKRCKSDNLLKLDKVVDSYFGESVLQLPGFTEEQIMSYKKRFYYDVFRKYSKSKALKFLRYRITDELPFGIKDRLVNIYQKFLTRE